MNLRITLAVALALTLCGCSASNGMPSASSGAPSLSPTSTPFYTSMTQLPTQAVTQNIPSPSPTSAPTATPAATASAPSITPSATVTAPRVTQTPFSLPPESPVDSGSVTFTHDGYGMPSRDLPVYQGIGFNIEGEIRSESPILSLELTVTDQTGGVYTERLTFAASDNVTVINTMENIKGQDSLCSRYVIDKLACGECHVELKVKTVSDNGWILLYSKRFTKLPKTQPFYLTPNSFRDGTYASALDFFGDQSQFMFSFKHDSGRNIVTLNDWEAQHIVQIDHFDSTTVQVHALAVPYFTKAYEYMASTLIRVRGNGFDSGVIPLSNVAATNYGTYVSRFVSGKRYVSHHAFGTAQDYNADMPSNMNNSANHKIIADEVALLTYEGLLEDGNGDLYHSFIYGGNCATLCGGVPETVSNYLLYELAFFRAGFSWGYYYSHTCDAMHFTLTELSPSLHEAENGGLRKVYEYADSQ